MFCLPSHRSLSKPYSSAHVKHFIEDLSSLYSQVRHFDGQAAVTKTLCIKFKSLHTYMLAYLGPRLSAS